MPRKKAASTDQAAPDITVSIVSYNTRELLRACLQSLLKRESEGEATLQVIVADNGSQDGSVEMVRDDFASVEVFSTGGNIGYGRANNKAFERSRGRYFFALNSDTEVEPGALAALRDWMDAHSEAGACGAQLMWPDGRIQFSYGYDPTLPSILYEQLGLHKVLHFDRVRHRAEMKPEEDQQPFEAQHVAGACLFARRQAYAQIGGFDPVYFMYHEDTDLCIRMRRAGWKIFLIPRARIIHHVGASSQNWRNRALMVSSYNASRHLFFSRHGGRAQGLLLKTMFLIGAAWRLTAWTILALARPSALDKVRLFRFVLRSNWKLKPPQMP